MSYCVNCGTAYAKPSGICPTCYLDQSIPEEIMDFELSKRRGRPIEPHDIDFGYPGEKAALTLAIGLSLVIAAVLGAISWGLFFAILVLSLVHIRLRHLQLKKNAIPVSERSFRTIHRLAKVAAYRLKLPLPDIYVIQDHSYNAYTSGFFGYGFLVLNSALVQDFQPSELLFVIGHELGHMKRYHTTWLTLLEPARAGGARFFLAPLMHIIFNVWSVKAEYTADQAGLIASNDLHAASTALLKLAGGSQVEKEVDFSPVGSNEESGAEIVSGLIEYLGTHPFIQNRVKHLVAFASSSQFRSARWWTSEPNESLTKVRGYPLSKPRSSGRGGELPDPFQGDFSKQGENAYDKMD